MAVGVLKPDMMPGLWLANFGRMRGACNLRFASTVMFTISVKTHVQMGKGRDI